MADPARLDDVTTLNMWWLDDAWSTTVALGCFSLVTSLGCGAEQGDATASMTAQMTAAGAGANGVASVVAGHSALPVQAGASGHPTATAGAGLAGAGSSSADPPHAGSSGATGMAAAAGSGGAPAAGSGASASALAPLTVYIAGDSTVSTYADTASDHDQAGWGQMLHEYLVAQAKVDNRAIGGRTARRFIDDGRLTEIERALHKGDFLLIQFGTNDSNRSASYTLNGQTIPYYLDPNTDFKTYLMRYIDAARSGGATPVLVTPPPRNSAYCTGGNGTGAYAQAMRELGTSQGVIVSDLNQKSVDYLKAICPAPSPPDFFLGKDDGSVDGTHFQERGARILAGFVADGLREAGAGFVRAAK